MWVDLFPLRFECCLLITNAIQLCMDFKLCANPSDTAEQLVCLKWNPWELCKVEISVEWGLRSRFLLVLEKTRPALTSNMEQMAWDSNLSNPSNSCWLQTHLGLESKRRLELTNKGERKASEKYEPYRILVAQCQPYISTYHTVVP